MKKQLVTLWPRPSRDKGSFTYYLRYVDLENKPRCISLRHCDKRKGEKQRTQKEKELRMGYCEPGSMKLDEFMEDSLRQTGSQIRQSTKTEYRQAVRHFIRIVGNIDFQSIDHKHGEQFRQACLDEGNSKNTVAKKIRQLKAMFELAVQRKLLDENPLKMLRPPKTSNNKNIRTYSDGECESLLRVAGEIQKECILEWDLAITLALTTGMRKGELLNMVWSDIDFGELTIEVTPKHDTDETWEWLIKDTDQRTLPLTEDVLKFLIAFQDRRPSGYPYVLVPPKRYDRIQLIRQGKPRGRKKTWTYEDARNSVINNFTDMFGEIRDRAGIKQHKTFHDLRRTAITNWFYEGLEIIEVMRLAGHSKYDTTLKYYLAVKDDLVDKARKAIKHRVSREMLGRCAQRSRHS